MRSLAIAVTMVAFALVGGGCSDEDVTLTLSPYDLVAFPNQFDFGALAVGAQLEGTIVVQNVGNGGAEVTQVALGGAGGSNFTLPESWSGDLNKEQEHAFKVIFSPEDEGYFEDRLILNVTTGTGTEGFEIRLRGRGVTAGLRAYPAVVDFGPVSEGDTGHGYFVVENMTDAPIEISDLSWQGEELGFDLDQPQGYDALPWTVEARATLEVPAVFEAPDDVGREVTLSLIGPDDVDWGVEIDLKANVCEGSAHPDWDNDGDGVTVCGGDCDDDDDDTFPGGVEVGDNVDNDCDGITDEGTELYDDDGDGMSEVAGDCNDANPETHTGADEIADGQDNDCDGDVDEGTTADDADGDGITQPAGDCDDTNALVYPGADELEDSMDNDCDGIVDETTSVYDDDGDGFCDNEVACIGGASPGDCNDGDGDAYPGATELVNGVDDDCDGIVDNGTPAFDNDGDGYTSLGGDCNDNDPDTYPGAPELADSQDNDCDGVYDEGTAFADDDGDGFAETDGDCNDSSVLIYPGAPEDLGSLTPGLGDGMDNDCDNLVDEGTDTYDDDGDGFSEVGGDCDDDDPDTSPGEYDPPADGHDWDCDSID
jgi:hypothetical protein